MAKFHPGILERDDWELAVNILGGYRLGADRLVAPDLVIAPDGEPYLYRWHLVKTPQACVYFHIQVADDPERPLHDHPWDNVSVILAGGYEEIIEYFPGTPSSDPWPIIRKPGDTICRDAEDAHRLLLLPNVDYSMSLFSTGPKRREWGFWYPEGWRHYKTVTTTTADGRSIHLPNARRLS